MTRSQTPQTSPAQVAASSASLWEAHGAPVVEDFDRHWDGTPPHGWAVVELPEAARDGLIARADRDLVREALEAQGRLDELDEVVGRILTARGESVEAAPTDDVDALLAAPTSQAGVGVGTSVVEPWPHQFDVARKVVSVWPTAAMFSDEVGLGKTIEIGLVLRELLVSGPHSSSSRSSSPPRSIAARPAARTAPKSTVA